MYTIIVKTSFIGFHRWENAPKEVAFLRDNHRHLFNVKLEIEVFEEDREIEFFILQKELNKFINKHKDSMQSCEWLAKLIVDEFEFYPMHRKVKATVYEDNENGGSYSNL